jgi:transketolase
LPACASQPFPFTVLEMLDNNAPSYLRLNLAATSPYPVPAFSQWRKIKGGEKLIVIGIGPVLGNLFALPTSILESLEIWSLSILPAVEMPLELIQRIRQVKNVLTIEEHAGECGINELLGKLILRNMEAPVKFNHLASKGYISGKYGDQKWHLEENGMFGAALEKNIRELL